MSSHKGSVVAQGNGAPASNRETDTLELAELGPLLEEKGTRVIANPTKVSCLPGVLPWAVISPQISVGLRFLRPQLPPQGRNCSTLGMSLSQSLPYCVLSIF